MCSLYEYMQQKPATGSTDTELHCVYYLNPSVPFLTIFTLGQKKVILSDLCFYCPLLLPHVNSVFFLFSPYLLLRLFFSIICEHTGHVIYYHK